MVAIIAAVLGFLGVRLVADLAGQSAAADSGAARPAVTAGLTIEPSPPRIVVAGLIDTI